MGPDEASTAGDENTLPLGGREKLHRWKAGEGRVRDRMTLWVVDRLGLEERELVLLRVGLDGGLLGLGGGGRIVGAQIEGAQDIEGNLAVETEALEAYGLDLPAILVKSLSLRGQKKRDGQHRPTTRRRR